MEDQSDVVDKNDDGIMPGFRFHPTDEELVEFYLKRKIQQKSLPIELIKQVDIYKYDPWDLPRLASSGEKEWYFYCPRDRKYRNSARPNRVTGAGFWKATGTDRRIYSSDGTKCIGLKKSLVFYRGRAAKGIKTDWMMHEFRLPSLGDPSPPKKFLDKSLPPNDAWAICRIFKKTNSMAQRNLPRSWVSSLPDTPIPSDLFYQTQNYNQFSSENISCTSEIGSIFQICPNSDLHQASESFSSSDFRSCKPVNPAATSLQPVSSEEFRNSFVFSPSGMSSGSGKCTVNESSMLLSSLENMSKNPDSIDFNNEFSINLSQNVLGSAVSEDAESFRNLRTMGFPFSFPGNITDAWKSGLRWDSAVCPTEISTTYSGNKC